MEVTMPSRKQQRAVRSTNPGQSAWWLLPPVGGIIAGASIPYLATHSTAWATAGGLIGATIGGTATATPQFREWISTQSERRHIAEIAGATTNINEEPLEALRVHRAYRDITEFVPRDIQDQLVEHLNNGTPVLIEGPSMAGKTRLAVEVIRAEWPNAPTWFPRDENDIEVLLNNHLEPTSKTIIILDDIDRFLNNQSLTLGRLNRWINNGCTIVGTMTRSAYVTHRTNEFEQVTGWDSVNRFHTLHLSDLLSQNELNDLATTSYSRFTKEIRGFGLGPTLSCAQDVRDALQEECAAKSQCSALIKAATDWKRIGLGAASKAQLTSLAEAAFCDDSSHLNWDEAWLKATTPINSVVPFINRVADDKWEVLDLIIDDNNNAGQPVSSDCLYAISSFNLNASQTLMAAIRMFINGGLSSQIEEMYARSVEANPDNIKVLGNYVKFLDNIQRKASYLDISSIQGNLTLSSHKLSIDFPNSLPAPLSGKHVNHYTLSKESLDCHVESIETHTTQIDTPLMSARKNQNRLSINPVGAFLKFLELKWTNAKNSARTYIGQSMRNRHNDNTRLAHIFSKDDSWHEHLYDRHHTKDVYDYILSLYPSNADILGHYAAFLDSALHDTDNADTNYQLALKIDPTNIHIICDYALFSFDRKKDYFRTERLYKRAVQIDPYYKHATRGCIDFLQIIRSNHESNHDWPR